MTNKNKSVGIILLNKTADGLAAILQIRAKWNTEKNSSESWPGACQVTVHGKLEAGEDFMGALLREIKEELGEEILPAIRALIDAGKIKELIHKNTSEQEIVTYGAIIEEKFLKILMSKPKNQSFGGFRIISRNEIEKIVNLQTFDKKIGVTDKNIIAMFPDEKEAVWIAFEKLDI